MADAAAPLKILSTLAIAAMSLLLVLRHRQNIVNLMQGKEGRIGAKKS